MVALGRREGSLKVFVGEKEKRSGKRKEPMENNIGASEAEPGPLPSVRVRSRAVVPSEAEVSCIVLTRECFPCSFTGHDCSESFGCHKTNFESPSQFVLSLPSRASRRPGRCRSDMSVHGKAYRLLQLPGPPRSMDLCHPAICASSHSHGPRDHRINANTKHGKSRPVQQPLCHCQRKTSQ